MTFILVGQPLAKLGAAVNRFGEILHWFDSSHESWPPKLGEIATLGKDIHGW
jgi:hypothetical protein